MIREFSPATAEQVAASVEAAIVIGNDADLERIAKVAELPKSQAESALALAVDLGLIIENNNKYSILNPISRFLITPNEMQKSAVIRVVLESYEPFNRFRERLKSTGRADKAAKQTTALLELNAHPNEVKDTLVSLGTYAQSLISKGGGIYESSIEQFTNPLEDLVGAADEIVKATALVRKQLGPDAVAIVSEDEVIAGLVDGFIRINNGDPDGAVFEAGNAVESYLERLADRNSCNLQGATGINSKIEKLNKHGILPRKLKFMGKYLGHIRNAADHGVDPDINQEWAISPSTGMEYVFVACSFISSVTAIEKNSSYTL